MAFKTIINWKLFFILLTACVISSLLVVPYSLALSPVQVEITPFLIVVSTVTNNLILFAIACFVGLLLSKRIGMGAPILEGALEGKNQGDALRAILLPSIVWGAVSGVLIVLLSIPFQSLSVEMLQAEVDIAPWKALLASFYGGIGEEVLLRLFVVSVLVWITFIIKKNKDGQPTKIGIWVSIVLAAMLFGLGHLPATAALTPLTFVVVLRAIVLNGAAGVIFGWLYWRKGLESAMIAHFTADIVLHIITPLVASFFV